MRRNNTQLQVYISIKPLLQLKVISDTIRKEIFSRAGRFEQLGNYQFPESSTVLRGHLFTLLRIVNPYNATQGHC